MCISSNVNFLPEENIVNKYRILLNDLHTEYIRVNYIDTFSLKYVKKQSWFIDKEGMGVDAKECGKTSIIKN